MQRTTIAVPPHVRDRLQAYGRKGMSYAQILQQLMDAVDPRDLADEQAHTYARPVSQVEVDAWRRKSPAQKLDVMETMRRAAHEAERRRRSS